MQCRFDDEGSRICIQTPHADMISTNIVFPLIVYNSGRSAIRLGDRVQCGFHRRPVEIHAETCETQHGFDIP